MTDLALVHGDEFNLTRFMPRDLEQLVKFSDYAAKSGVFGTMNPGQALIIMLQGAELGINPLQSLREIPLVNGKPRPSATLVAGLIQRSRECESWYIDSTPVQVVLKAKRRGREEATVVVRIEDVPKSLKSKQVWQDNPEDMLVARAIHRMARRHFADILAGIQDPDEIDETRVIDVAKVEQFSDPIGMLCGECGRGQMFLQAGRNGGAYLRCNNCGVTAEPPQEVRDLIRGTPEHLTLAATAEPVPMSPLAPGERLPDPGELDAILEAGEPVLLDSQPLPVPEGLTLTQTVPTTADAPVSAVQSESEREIIGEDVVTEPASAENAPIPEPAAGDTHLALRNAIYNHWLLPRPAANIIAMRGLLNDFGWKGDQQLGDWLLGLPEDKLAAIADAVVTVR